MSGKQGVKSIVRSIARSRRRLAGAGVHPAGVEASSGTSSSSSSSFATLSRAAYPDQTPVSGASNASEWFTTSIHPAGTASPGSSQRSSQAKQKGQQQHQQQQQQLPAFWIQPSSSSSSASSLYYIAGLSAPASSSSSAPAAASSPPSPTPSSSSEASTASSTRWNTRNSDSGVQVPPSSKQAQPSHLVLHPGAYGIPKRSAGASSRQDAQPGRSKGKGKEREMDTEEAGQGLLQLDELKRAMLSVQVGEDAYFVRQTALGVADGVGGWTGKKGADPGLFAARLMHHCSAELAHLESTRDRASSPNLAFIAASSASNLSRQSDDSAAKASGTAGYSSSGRPRSAELQRSQSDTAGTTQKPSHLNDSDAGDVDPVELLHKAWDITLTEFCDLDLIGSTTALIALLHENELRLANIGDCCCSVIRGQDYIFRSQEQQHSFNYPFQLGTNSQDTPRKDGQRYSIKVQKNDIVILSSDGLVDNLFDEDILEEVLQYDGSPQALSQALCTRAKAVSEDQRAISSPFQQRANEEGIHFVGGKHDDISVLVAVIGDAE